MIIVRLLLSLAGGVPMLLVSFFLLSMWVSPETFGAETWLKPAASLIMFEFLLLHSGAFMAAGPFVSEKRWIQHAWFAGFGLVYALSIVGYSIWSGTPNAAWIIASIMLSRLVTVIIFRDKKGTIMMLQRSAIGMVLLVVTALVLLLPLPELGLTEDIRLAVLGKPDDLATSYPNRMLAWGSCYFLLMALVEFLAGWYLPDWTDKQAEDAWQRLGNS